VLLSDQEQAIPIVKLALISGMPRYTALDAYFYLLVACQILFLETIIKLSRILVLSVLVVKCG